MMAANSVVLQAQGAWWSFRQPLRLITTNQLDQIIPALQALDTAVNRDGLYAAGFLSYEAGSAFGLRTHTPSPHDPPLLWFGLYQAPEIVRAPPYVDQPQFLLGDWQPGVSETDYHRAIGQVKVQIAAGYTYQVNYTFPLRATFSGDPWDLFTQIARAQQAEYTAYVDIGSHAICSASPELFFTLDGQTLSSKPMKGTAARGRTFAEDEENINWLHHSEKNRAENVMIVDMIRNDMGRVATIGSVRVPRLFEVERYPTVLQMTSTVTARTAAPISDIMAALFPCASITGAPKVSTMHIINTLEPEPRGVYTGAIGYLAPATDVRERQAQFNVAIRTVVVDRERKQATYGVGGGIVWDSDAAAEFEECRIKTRVLRQPRPSFQLLESVLWTPEDDYFLADEHVARLRQSAVYFGYPLAEAAVRHWLRETAATLTQPAKVRLLVDNRGRLTGDTQPLHAGAGSLPEPVRVGLAANPVSSDDVWLYHKTTQRGMYDAARASRPDCDDVILWNERGELTESSSANLVLRLDGNLLTPPLTAGLLAGTYRDWLLQQGRIKRQTLTCDDLRHCDEIWLINSVRRWRAAELVIRK